MSPSEINEITLLLQDLSNDIKEVKQGLKDVNKLLLGNGSIGVLECQRNLQQDVASMKPIVNKVKDLYTVKSVVKQVVITLVTIAPFAIPVLLWISKISANLAKLIGG